MSNGFAHPDLARRFTEARAERGALPGRIQLLEEEIRSVRRALEKAETEYEQGLLTERLGDLREDLSAAHAAMIRAHHDYDAVRKDSLWARSTP